MVKVYWGNSLWQLVTQADATSRIVLLILLAMSILCWSVFLYKLILLRVKKRQLKDAIESVGKLQNLEELVQDTKKRVNTLPGYVITKILTLLKKVSCADAGETLKLDVKEWEFFQQSSHQIVDNIADREDSLLSLLMTSAQIAPLLGLFGTVWGLIHSFIRISEKQSADITTVAPGIAEALITTLVGLAVAIPAYALFQYLNGQIRVVIRRLDDLSEMCGRIIRSHCVKSS